MGGRRLREILKLNLLSKKGMPHDVSMGIFAAEY